MKSHQRLWANILLVLLTMPAVFSTALKMSSSVNASIVPAGSDIYIFAGNETGLRLPLKSNGNGTFTAAASFTYGDNNRGGAIADYDEDGDLDFAGCNDDVGECHIFEQTTSGVFTQAASIAGGAFPLAGVESGMAADDFNQDGHADVLMGGNQAVASIFFGDGTGVFPTNINNLLPTALGGAAYTAKDSGDLDGNGYPDIILGAVGGGNIYTYLNTAGVFSGPFTLFDATPTVAAPNIVAVADFDGDGYIDIIAGGEASGEMNLWKGDGTGNSTSSFVFQSTIHDFNTQTSGDSYDFDSDGDQDLVALRRDTGEIFSLTGNGNGTFITPVLVTSIAPSAFGLAAPPAAPIRSKVSGSVFHDFNTDGINNDGGVGVGGILLTLTGTDHIGNAVNLTAFSAANGSYVISGVPIDNGNGYTLTATPPNPPPTLYSPTTSISRSLTIPKENTARLESFGYLLCTDADGDSTATEGGACGPVDCNDTSSGVYPGAAEQCNGVDDDCSGTIDEGFDADNDGYYTGGGVCGAIDCNDGNATINPGATEVCDAVDNNCDGTANEGFDQDGDGFSLCNGDCNDINISIHPGATEICDAIDNNCSGTTDEGFDQDGDGVTTCTGDCNDANIDVNPNAPEQCDGLDNDCNSIADDGFDHDEDGYATCTGDCNDNAPTIHDASVTITVANIVSTGPGADMTADIYIGNGSSAYGTTTVTIPLTLNGSPIIDPTSSSDVTGLHVERGVEDGKSFVRINAYGHNQSTTREHVEGTVVLDGAVIDSVDNGPNGPYEKPSNDKCNNPSDDEYELSADETTGSFCTTTNTHSDNVTIYYALSQADAQCASITNPATKCGDPLYAVCGVCIHPGMPDPFGDGVDNNCDGSAECGMRTEYVERKCAGKMSVTSDTELDAYLLDFGLQNNKYRNLEIAYNVNRPLIEIHTPCKIIVKQDMDVTGDTICLDGRKGVRAEPQVSIDGSKIALLSEKGSVWLKTNGIIAATTDLIMQGWKKVIVGSSATISGTSHARFLSFGHKGTVSLNPHSIITTATIHMAAAKKARVASQTVVTVSGSYFMEAPICSIHQNSTIAAGSTSGSCFASTTTLAADEEGDEEDPELMGSDIE
ncbi:MAG TPA: MopE-related protein [Candidatus Peribacterales bacterium]|nr:MopE-related protein [Candidatus Peribacterales bacterium]